jgi:hypothetical protein
MATKQLNFFAGFFFGFDRRRGLGSPVFMVSPAVPIALAASGS